MKKGRCGTMTHDYKRNTARRPSSSALARPARTRSWVNALNATAPGSSFASCAAWTMSSSARCLCIWVLDDYGTHKHPQGQGLAAASSSFRGALHPSRPAPARLNFVESMVCRTDLQAHPPRHFSSARRPQAGHRRVPRRLETSNPRPFVWTATVESIARNCRGARQTLEQIQPACTRPRHPQTQKITVRVNPRTLALGGRLQKLHAPVEKPIEKEFGP